MEPDKNIVEYYIKIKRRNKNRKASDKE